MADHTDDARVRAAIGEHHPDEELLRLSGLLMPTKQNNYDWMKLKAEA